MSTTVVRLLVRLSIAFTCIILCAAFFFWGRVLQLLRSQLRRELTRRTGAPVSLATLTLHRWGFEVTGLQIGNAPGTWSAPYALSLDRLRVGCRLQGLLSLAPFQGLQDFRLGPLEFTLGFRVKEISTFDVDGFVLYVEERASGGAASSNAPWIEAGFGFFARKKAGRVKRAERRRREWRQQWLAERSAREGVEASGESGESGDGETDDGGGGGVDGDEPTASPTTPKSPRWLHDWRAKLHDNGKRGVAFLERAFQTIVAADRRWSEKAVETEAAQSEARLEEATEWRVGRLKVSAMAISMNGQRFELAGDGWTLRAFSGSEASLFRRVLFGVPQLDALNLDALTAGRGGEQLGLVAKLLKDSGHANLAGNLKRASEAVAGHVAGAKAVAVATGDEAVAAVSGAAAAVAAGVSDLRERASCRLRETHQQLAQTLVVGAKKIDEILDKAQ